MDDFSKIKLFDIKVQDLPSWCHFGRAEGKVGKCVVASSLCLLAVAATDTLRRFHSAKCRALCKPAAAWRLAALCFRKSPRFMLKMMRSCGRYLLYKPETVRGLVIKIRSLAKQMAAHVKSKYTMPHRGHVCGIICTGVLPGHENRQPARAHVQTLVVCFNIASLRASVMQWRPDLCVDQAPPGKGKISAHEVGPRDPLLREGGPFGFKLRLEIMLEDAFYQVKPPQAHGKIA